MISISFTSCPRSAIISTHCVDDGKAVWVRFHLIYRQNINLSIASLRVISIFGRLPAGRADVESRPRDPLHGGKSRYPGICYKSYSKHYHIRTPAARWWFRARQLCCRGPSTPPTTNFYKKQSSKKSISGFTRSIFLKI